MQLTGSHVLDATPDRIWEMLMNPDILAKITPGITRLEKLEEDVFKAIADVKIGPVSGSFSGDLTVTDKNAPNSFTLNIAQSSKIGNAQAAIKMNLKTINDMQTELSFDGDAKLSGVLARTGQRVISGVANMLSKQFFEALQLELK